MVLIDVILLFHNLALIFTSLGHLLLNDAKPNLPFEQGTTIRVAHWELPWKGMFTTEIPKEPLG
jgi:hypothetical protein